MLLELLVSAKAAYLSLKPRKGCSYLESKGTAVPFSLYIYFTAKGEVDLPVPQYFELFHNNCIVSGHTHYGPELYENFNLIVPYSGLEPESSPLKGDAIHYTSREILSISRIR